MVIPRSRSSGALSIWSNALNSACPLPASTFVMAAVSVVFPWSTCPIVPMLTCGFVLSNFALAICAFPPYVGSLSLYFSNDLFGDGFRSRLVVVERHRVGGATLRGGPEVGGVAEHLG